MGTAFLLSTGLVHNQSLLGFGGTVTSHGPQNSSRVILCLLPGLLWAFLSFFTSLTIRWIN